MRLAALLKPTMPILRGKRLWKVRLYDLSWICGMSNGETTLEM